MAKLEEDGIRRAYMDGWRRGVIGMIDRTPEHHVDGTVRTWSGDELLAFDAGYDAGTSARRRACNDARRVCLNE